MNANSKNHFNIIATVNIKGWVARPVEYVILKCTTNAPFFTVYEEAPFYRRISVGNIFSDDNCTLHFLGECAGLRNTLFS